MFSPSPPRECSLPIVEPFHALLAFSVGIASGFLPCCFVCYPGMFAYLQSNLTKPSRARAGRMCLFFSAGILLVGGILTIALLSLGIALKSLVSPASGIVNLIGFGILLPIGIAYLAGKSIRVPVPKVGSSSALGKVKGYKGVAFYGIFMGGPGQAHCSVTVLIPVVFLSLSTLTIDAIAWYFFLYSVGRIIPLLVAGLTLQDMQSRLVREVIKKSSTINRLIGAIFVAGGLVLFFTV
jgi:cytochrome c biogenesis protein CcdA